jgi:hypothetical protein
MKVGQGDKKSIHKFDAEISWISDILKPKEKTHGRIALRLIKRKWFMKMKIGWNWLRSISIGGDEPSDSPTRKSIYKMRQKHLTVFEI